MNRVTLIGNLGNDAELKVTAGGHAVLKFSVATSEKWTDKQSGEKKEKTEWHRCVSFQKGAEKLAQYLTKGTKVAVEGSMSYGSYEKDGVTFYTADVKVQNIELLGSKRDSDSTQPRAPSAPAENFGGDLPPLDGDDEIPF